MLQKKKQKKELQKFQRIELSINALAKRLLKIMRSHVGRENSLSRSQLFFKVYGHPESYFTTLQLIALWTLLKRAMHRCRQRTKCFITNEYKKGNYHYFVVKDWQDAQVYDRIVKRTIKALNGMNARCQKAVEEEWWQDPWEYD